MDNVVGNENSIENAGDLPPKYWLSLEQWSQDPDHQKKAESEFWADANVPEPKQNGWARRDFLKIMGASMALTSFGCVRRPAQKIVPYVQRPDEILPGVANYYTSSLVDANESFGVIVKTREGRPINIEGNPSHPMNRGSISARGTAQILKLYDPDRISGPRKGGKKGLSWSEADKELAGHFKVGGVAFLTGSILSPSAQDLLGSFVNSTQAKHYQWDTIPYDSIVAGQQQSYSRGHHVPRYRLNKARRIVSLGADFMGTFVSPTEMAKDFAEGRKPSKGMNQLVVFESLLSLTGANADKRYQVRSSQLVDVAMWLLHELVVVQKKSAYAHSSSLVGILESFAAKAKSKGHAMAGASAKDYTEMATDLWAHKGASLILAGHLGAQNLSLQVAVNLLNSILENDGKTIQSANSFYTGFQGSAQQLADLIKSLEAGEVKTLVIQGVNPGYATVAGLAFSAALKKAKTVIYVGDRMDETAQLAHFVLPESHSLEEWGDLESQQGVFSIQQPAIRPLNDTRSFLGILLGWSKALELGSSVSRDAESVYDFVRSYWESKISSTSAARAMAKDFESFWLAMLEKGVIVLNSSERERSQSARSFNDSAFSHLRGSSPSAGIELELYTTVGLMDGSLSNVPWLHELPDPVTKICWDNYATISIARAKTLKLSEGDHIALKVGGSSIEVPVHIQPGQHGDVIGLALGFGREKVGRVGNGVGKNAYPLATYSPKEGVIQYSGLKLEVLKSTAIDHTDLACPQGHHSMEGRQIVVEATLKQFTENPSANIHRHKMFSLWDKHEYKGHKWGLNIDLNSCNGCSACVVACQSENNWPSVGKEYVKEGRIMQWIRLDRYYVGNPENPDTVHMPVMCQHCDNAPCESVCPVAATVHGPEGTNDMIYNRCVGTRYCANNCPYKVRRFNWFDYEDPVESPRHMALNPDVTVRSRGVMEKCSLCIHRVKDGKKKALDDGRSLDDGDIKTACQQACPVQAITFGDLNDDESQVSQENKDGRTYVLLEELNNVPAVKYRSKIRNTDHLKSAHVGHGAGSKKHDAAPAKSQHGEGGHS